VESVIGAVEAHASMVLLIVASDCAILTLVALILVLRSPGRASRPGRQKAPGEAAVRHDLAEIAERLAALEKNVARVVEALPRSIQRVGVVRFNAFPDVGGNMSFSLALLDGEANGVILSVIHDRQAARVYGKAVQGGTSSTQLSPEELKALTLARGNHE
jgi:hypothetical protein